MDDATAQSQPVPENLRVAELICYTADFERALEFYTTVVGCKLSWKADGFCGLSLSDKYRLSLVAAEYEGSWQAGQPLPAAQLSMQSDDLAATVARVRGLGYEISEPSGDPASNVTAALRTPDGAQIFIFQDAGGGAQPGPGGSAEPYPFVETLYFVTDKAASEKFFADCLGLQAFMHHGEVYTGLTTGGVKDAGLIVGLMSWSEWWDTPQPGEVPAAPRLVIECPDLDAEHARLSAAGGRPLELRSCTVGLRWFNLPDPDGALITYWQYTPPPAE